MSPSVSLAFNQAGSGDRGKKWRRVARVAFGILCLAFTAYALLPSLSSFTSTRAVFNAPLITLRSPIAGTVKWEPASEIPGAATESGVIRVETYLPDDGRLDELRSEIVSLRTRLEVERLQLKTLESLSDQLAASSKQYQEASIRRLEHLREASRAALAQSEASQNQRLYEQQLSSRLVRSGSVSDLEFVTGENSADVARHGATRDKHILASVEEQLRSAKNGIYVGEGDGRADVPYSGQRLHELMVRESELRLNLRSDEIRLTETEARAKAEEARVARRSRFEIAPEGIVYRRHVVSGSTVTAGGSLVDCLDPSTIFIDAVISEDLLAQVRSGVKVRVRIAGGDEEFPAEVKQVTGHTLPWTGTTLAVEPIQLNTREVHVILALANNSTAGQSLPVTAVGLPAEVSFQREFSVLNWLFRGIFGRSQP